MMGIPQRVIPGLQIDSSEWHRAIHEEQDKEKEMFVLKEIVVEPINCDFCKTKIPRPTRTQKYCNEKCRSDANNERKAKERKSKDKPIYNPICRQCKKTFLTTSKRRMYCDDECKRLFRSSEDKKKRRDDIETKEENHTIDPYFLTGKR